MTTVRRGPATSIAATSFLAAIAFTCALVGFGRATAFAQSAEAEALFAEGVKLEEQDKLAEACDAFEASNRIEARAGTLIRLGQCREANDQLASAWSAYKDALTRVKDPRKKQVATDRIAAIEPRLSYLTVLVPDESRVDGLEITRDGKLVDPGLWNRAIPVDGGDYVIAGRAPGHEAWSTTVTVPAELGKVSAEVPRFKEMVRLVDKPSDPVVTDEARDDEPTRVDGGGGGTFTTKRKISIGLAGAGVGAIVFGGVFGAQASGLEADADALCPERDMCARADEANDLIDQGKSKAMLANVAYGVGAAAIVGAAVLWFTGAPDERDARVSVSPRLGDSTGLDVLVRF